MPESIFMPNAEIVVQDASSAIHFVVYPVPHGPLDQGLMNVVHPLLERVRGLLPADGAASLPASVQELLSFFSPSKLRERSDLALQRTATTLAQLLYGRGGRPRVAVLAVTHNLLAAVAQVHPKSVQRASRSWKDLLSAGERCLVALTGHAQRVARGICGSGGRRIAPAVEDRFQPEVSVNDGSALIVGLGGAYASLRGELIASLDGWRSGFADEIGSGWSAGTAMGELAGLAELALASADAAWRQVHGACMHLMALAFHLDPSGFRELHSWFSSLLQARIEPLIEQREEELAAPVRPAHLAEIADRGSRAPTLLVLTRQLIARLAELASPKNIESARSDQSWLAGKLRI